MSELWLIRKASHHLIGPVDRGQAIEMVEQGLLDSNDELCPENSYWFTLGEVEEVRRWLGIDHVFVRQVQDNEEEPTLTNDTEITNVNATVAIPEGLTQSRVATLQRTPAPTGKQLASQFQRPPSAIIGFPSQKTELEPHEMSLVEKPKIWSLLILLASIAVGVALVLLLRMLRA